MGMDVSVIRGDGEWRASEWPMETGGQGVVFLAAGSCRMDTVEYSAPLAIPFLSGRIAFSHARAVVFSVREQTLRMVVPDALSLRIVEETFFQYTRSASHRQAALQLVIYQLAQCEPIDDARGGEGLVEGILAYMHANLGEAINLDHLSETFGYSKSRIISLFKESGHRAPMKELADLRIEEASRLLQENELTVAQIARACGYGDLSAFNHFFRRHTGFSPRYYRENCLWLT